MSNKTFRPYAMDQQYLLPPSLRDWLPEGHLALFVSDVVDSLDLSAIMRVYEQGDGRGMPPYHPVMMVKLLVYGYCTGKTSSRKIERATHEDVPFRVLAANQHPDHDSISTFRQRHLPALAGLFAQVLVLAQELKLIKLGHVALDGTKIKANASKHKAMSYRRMCEAKTRIEQEVAELLAEAARVDAEEDALYGRGRRGDELPEDLQRRTTRLNRIREAMEALEQRARERAEAEAVEARQKIADREQQSDSQGKKPRGRPIQVPDPEQAQPGPSEQRNFTDPESRIMVDGATKSFEQCYNAQAAVDAEGQIIVAADVTQQTNDKQQLVPMLEQVRRNLQQLPARATADAGYFSEVALTHPALADIDLYVPPDRQKHGVTVPAPAGDPAGMSLANRMRAKLAAPSGRAVYARRKAIVEPVFGQIKQARGFRRFSFRGLAKVTLEWMLMCLTHNLLKIYRSGRWQPA
jgi:transposase